MCRLCNITRMRFDCGFSQFAGTVSGKQRHCSRPDDSDSDWASPMLAGSPFVSLVPECQRRQRPCLGRGAAPHSPERLVARDKPKPEGNKAADLRGMKLKNLAKQMIGHTAGVPGSKASKNKLRRSILSMVWQIEIETGRRGMVRLATLRVSSAPSHRVTTAVEGIEYHMVMFEEQAPRACEQVSSFRRWVARCVWSSSCSPSVVPCFWSTYRCCRLQVVADGGDGHVHCVVW